MLNTPQLLVGTPTKLAQAALTATPAAIYTVPNNQRSAIYDITVCNTTAGTLAFTIYSGSAATTANALFYSSSLSPNTTLQWSGFQVLNSADTITASASATGITATISGMESI